MVLYTKRMNGARNQGDEYICIFTNSDGSRETSDWTEKWLRAFKLNNWVYTAMTMFQFLGVLGGYIFTLRLLAWCTVCLTGPAHLSILIYTTVVRYNVNGRECSLNADNKFVHDDSEFL